MWILFWYYRISGYILLPEGLTILSNRVYTIMNWPEPHQVKGIQSFLSFCNFYCHFIENYSNIVISLMHLICKNASWNFSELCKQTFAALKEAFTFTPVLAHWVPDAHIVVETDTSNYVLRAILSIYSTDSDIHLIAFHFCTFFALELNI